MKSFPNCSIMISQNFPLTDDSESDSMLITERWAVDEAGERVAAELAYDTDGLVRKKKEGEGEGDR